MRVERFSNNRSRIMTYSNQSKTDLEPIQKRVIFGASAFPSIFFTAVNRSEMDRFGVCIDLFNGWKVFCKQSEWKKTLLFRSPHPCRIVWLFQRCVICCRILISASIQFNLITPAAGAHHYSYQFVRAEWMCEMRFSLCEFIFSPHLTYWVLFI